MTLKEKYNQLTDEYIEVFTKKHGFVFELWTTPERYHAWFKGNNIFTIFDIMYDIDNNIEKGKIKEWQDYTVAFLLTIPFEQYLKGNKLLGDE